MTVLVNSAYPVNVCVKRFLSVSLVIFVSFDLTVHSFPAEVKCMPASNYSSTVEENSARDILNQANMFSLSGTLRFFDH